MDVRSYSHINIHEKSMSPFSFAEDELQGISTFQKAANYIALAQIYLKENALLRNPLRTDDIKERLLGHWGTCPGLIFCYTHLTAYITRHMENEQQFLFVTGPGHGAPGILACLYLEGTISRFFHDESWTEGGFNTHIRKFSWPESGRPSHINAATPGSIHEGGELGYALSVAFGSVMDKPDLIAAVVVGDGEAETGPTATAWHGHKFIDPSESGAVLPILHRNRYKISEKTIFGTMDKEELVDLFTGYGFQVYYLDYDDHVDEHTIPGDKAASKFDLCMAQALQGAINLIRSIQSSARSGQPISKPRWPMIILTSPKGWGCPKELDGRALEGSFRCHQVPITDPRDNRHHFETLEAWLKSYEPQNLFRVLDTGELAFHHAISYVIPKESRRCMGMVPDLYVPALSLDLPPWNDLFAPSDAVKSSMEVCGEYLKKVIRSNPRSFRIFSPDELVSNRLDKVFEVSLIGKRNFQWDPESCVHAGQLRQGGRIIEMLSEHTLQGFAQGYTLTGRVSLFPSYESFLGIVATMIEQYAKFLHDSKVTRFRPSIPSITYIETSTLWRQEHNGFSHQNPGLINSLLNLPHGVIRIFFPADANCALSTLNHCLGSKNYVNLIVGSKHHTKIWLDEESTKRHCKTGGTVWAQYSTDKGSNPDIVIAGIGVETTAEAIAASYILQKDLPGIRIRLVNIIDLMIFSKPSEHPHALSEDGLWSLFTSDRPIIFNFHGYISAISGLLGDRLTPKGKIKRPIRYHGYIEKGTTTTPWSMMRLNRVDRYSICQSALDLLHSQEVLTYPFSISEQYDIYENKKRYHEGK